MSVVESHKAHFSGDDEALFRKLKTRPVVAWPTVSLMLACHVLIGWVWYMGLTGQLNLFLGCLLNSMAMYYLFSPIHDSMHQAVFRRSRLNNIFLAVAVFPIIPLSTGQFLRMMHMQHHRFTNGEADPDHEVSKTFWNAFHIWPFWAFLYGPFYMRHRDKYPDFNLRLVRYDAWVSILLFVPGLLFIPAETLLLWIIPVFVMGWLICAVFMYLPHRPHTVRAADDPYKATLIRQGWEWLLCPLMANQNYHLVHHLYPTVPFYRYKKVWNARYHYHNSRNPAVVRPLQLYPDNLQPGNGNPV